MLPTIMKDNNHNNSGRTRSATPSFGMLLNALLEEKRFSTKSTFISLLSNHWKQSSHESLLISKMKSCLSASNTRVDGLLLLNTFFDHFCADSLTVENLLFWAQICVKAIQENKSHSQKQLSFEVLIKIFESIPRVAHVSSERALSSFVSQQFLSANFELLVTNNEEMPPMIAIECLRACICAFGASLSASKRVSIEKFLLTLVKRSEDQSVLSQCFAKLCICGANSSNLWKQYLMRSLRALNTSFDRMKSCFTDSTNSLSELSKGIDSQWEPLFEEPPNEDFSPFLQVEQRWREMRFTSSLICHLLTQDFPQTIQMPINAILSLCVQMCSLSPTKVQSMALDVYSSALLTIVPSLHEMSFDIMEALLLSCKTAIIGSNCLQINRLIEESLEWSETPLSTNGNNAIQSFALFRARVYTFIQKWTQNLGLNCDLIQMEMKWLLQQILNDIKPRQAVLKLKTNETKSNENNKALNPFLVLNALKALKSIVYTFAPLIEEAVYEFLFKEIIQLLETIYRSNANPIGFESEECRKELLNVLLALLVSANCPQLIPRSALNTSCALFTEAQTLDESLHVKHFCDESIVFIHCLIRLKSKPLLDSSLARTSTQSENAFNETTMSVPLSEEETTVASDLNAIKCITLEESEEDEDLVIIESEQYNTTRDNSEVATNALKRPLNEEELEPLVTTKKCKEQEVDDILKDFDPS